MVAPSLQILKDSARDIPGAIAQTISFMGINDAVINGAKVDALLSDTGKLAVALSRGFGGTVAYGCASCRRMNRPAAPVSGVLSRTL